MQAANELVVQATSNIGPVAKINMDCPLLDDCISFEQYKRLVVMWAGTTDIDKRKLGAVLSMTIPIDSKKYGDGLRADLFEDVHPETLMNNIQGVNLILDFLESRLGQDEREAQIEAFVKFIRFYRKSGQSIEVYVLEFDRLIKKCKSLDMEFNDNVSAFFLLINADLNTIESKLIKAVLNIKDDKGKLFPKTKKKLVEMLSNNMESVVTPMMKDVMYSSHRDVMLINNKGNPDAIQANYDVMVAAGWKPPHKHKPKHKQRYDTKPSHSNHKHNRHQPNEK